MLSNEIISSMVNGLKNIFENSLCFIILYGSEARREATPESDIDIAVILKKPITIEQKRDFIKLMSSLDLEYDRVFSLIDIELEKYEKWGEILPFYKNIKKDGIILWEAA